MGFPGKFPAILPFVALLVAVGVANAADTTAQRLVIVTSFPKQMSELYKSAFERANPGVEVEIVKKKTSAGLKYLQKDPGAADLFWVSAPDAFEVLKKRGLLRRYRPEAEGIPRRLSGYPVNDPDGYYSGFAAAGYGIMWNRNYLRSHHLSPPREWIDLTRPEYRSHIVLSAPSRSGTTHLTIEAILQLRGWQRGWSLIKSIAANARRITAKSIDVPDGVAAGEFGIGVVIDFYGLMTGAAGAPVEFTYPSETVLVPANIAILKHAPQPRLAARFVEFLLSPEGQQLLLDPRIQRLPIRPATYLEDALPEGFPQPYGSKELGAHIAFDVLLSRRRYNVINSLFDVMITYQLEELRTAMAAVQRAETLLQSSPQPLPALAGAAARARSLIYRVPVDELTASNPRFVAKFAKKRTKVSDTVAGEQGKIERAWHSFATRNYRIAREIIQQAMPDS